MSWWVMCWRRCRTLLTLTDLLECRSPLALKVPTESLKASNSLCLLPTCPDHCVLHTREVQELLRGALLVKLKVLDGH